jgi:MtN3 and saliva related transmembrane protein
MQDISQVFGWTATILFSAMLIPQIIKTVKSKDTRGVSILLFIIYLTANIIALTYAFLIGQTPLKIKYSIGILTSVFYIALFIYYKKSIKK